MCCLGTKSLSCGVSKERSDTWRAVYTPARLRVKPVDFWAALHSRRGRLRSGFPRVGKQASFHAESCDSHHRQGSEGRF